MKKKVVGVVITIVFGLVTFFLNPLLFPPPVGVMPPTDSQVVHLMIVGAIESLAFGVGVAFLIFTVPWLSAVQPEKKSRTAWAIAATTWLLVSWWPHDQLHMMIGMDYSKLILIEYGFHVTLILAAIIVARYLFKNLTEHA